MPVVQINKHEMAAIIINYVCMRTLACRYNNEVLDLRHKENCISAIIRT